MVAYIQMLLLTFDTIHGSQTIIASRFTNGMHLFARIQGSGYISMINSGYDTAAFFIRSSEKIVAQGLQLKETFAKIFGSGNIYYWGTPILQTTQQGSKRVIKKDKSMVIKNYKNELLVGFILFLFCIVTIVYGQYLKTNAIAVRTWDWNNLIWMLSLFPLLLLQQKASLPPVVVTDQKKHRWVGGFLVGMFFGILDVVVIKMILHPQPYTMLPGYLQPFPYSIFLFGAGAIEIELYYRMIPISILLLLTSWLFKGKFRKTIVIILAIVTSLIEPIQQMPDGEWWLIIYATVSGIAMNAWQFKCYLKNGFLASLAVRLGHYLIWHILLGVYVEYFELM